MELIGNYILMPVYPCPTTTTTVEVKKWTSNYIPEKKTMDVIT